MDTLSRGRIQTAEEFMQVARSTLGCALPQPLSQLFRPGRPGKQTFQQRAQVKPGPANHNGEMPARVDLL